MHAPWGGMEEGRAKQIPVVFYRTSAGTEIVREWLQGLDPGDRQAVGLDLMRVQYRWPVGMPLCRPLKDGLWEVRTTLPSPRIARVLFCVHAEAIIVLSGFIKKTQKTPDDEMVLARRRMREFLD
ncbi:type II toxin-antitoxin system RelE/ParE family toxin [Mesorhizobium sp. M1322]|uniref:type II toxin-antitoxin system RelE/ParE family toxin n=1 Tax=Mesorhizobium sp. M1322 TaxID=2957081 RepID=UPI00333C2936